MTVPVDTWTDKVMRFKVQEDRYDADSNYCKSLLLSLGYGNGSGINYIKELWVSDLMIYEITEEEYNASTYTPIEYNELDNFVRGDNEVVVKDKNFLNETTLRQGARYASTLSTQNRLFFDSNYYIIQGETYTISTNIDTSIYRYAININDKTFPIPNDDTLEYDSGWKIQASFTFTATVSGYLGIPISRVNDSDLVPSDISNYYFQLEKGSQATSYIEYKEKIYPISIAKIPSEYQEVEYIQSNGSQYINTGYPLWNTTNWKIQANFSIDEHYNYNAMFGFDDVTDTANEVWIYSNTNYAWRACGKTNISLMPIPLDTKVTVVHDNSGNNFITTLDGVEKWNTTKATSTANHNLCFGHRTGGGWLKGKIYGLKLWSEGALVRDFIPCYRISDNIAGLYDTVNNVFYPNANTGSTAQPFISGEKNRTTIQLSENDKLWNNNGTWQLNDTAITDNYLLEQLQALDNIELYENLCYVDWVGIEKPTMNLLYSGTEDLGIKYIITEDGKKIRTDWRKLGRRKKWKMK